MLDLGTALVDRVRARLALSPAVTAMVPLAALDGRGVPFLRFATPDIQWQGNGRFGAIEIAMTLDTFAPDRQAAYRIGRAAMSAICPMKYRLKASRAALVVLRWSGDYHAQTADEAGVWQYGQQFQARGIAG